MAEKKRSLRGKLFKLFKWLFLLIVLVILAGAGFAAGVYFKLIDTQKILSEYNLTNHPLVAKYFPQAATNFEPVELGPDTARAVQTQPLLARQATVPIKPATPSPLPRVNDATKKTDNIAAASQQTATPDETAKRSAKLARLYSSMKPDEAVAILNQLDDDTVLAILSKMEEEQVAKLMAAFEASRAARLTEAMLKGRLTN